MTVSKSAVARLTKTNLTHNDYGVAIFSPLEVEMSAVRYMLDEEHECLPSKEGDPNHYICGRMSGHNVLIAYLPYGQQGMCAAANVAVHMKRSFPSVTLYLLVGIGGGVPSDIHDIRLGDVVVSMPSGTHGGIVQYDLGKETIDGFERKGVTDPPDLEWRCAVVKMRSAHHNGVTLISNYINTMIEKHPGLTSYLRPAPEQDILFRPTYQHPRHEFSCRTCDDDQKVARVPRVRNAPAVFYGLIASGNRVIKNATTRDRIAKEVGGALCFEMEAIGLMHDSRCVIIRGISDYADSHKNDEWHSYAAATAAGCAKELLTYVKVKTTGRAPIQNQHWCVGRVSNPRFTGRDKLISKIRHVVETNVIESVQKEQCVIVITGMGGQGKTEICLRLANEMRSRFWGVFWADVGSHTSAEGDFLILGQQLNLSSPSIDSVRRYLANREQPWLLILDNADDTSVDYQKYFPAGNLGAILLTSRNPDCLQYATELKTLSLQGLSNQDASELLMKTAQIQEHQHEHYRPSAERIAASLLHGHPLAIIQAGAYLSRGHCSLAQYPSAFEEQRQRLLTYRLTQAQSRYHDIYATFEASVDMLEIARTQKTEDALQLLSVVSMFATCQLPLSLFEQAWIGGRQILRETGNKLVHDERVDHLVQWHVEQLLPLSGVEHSAWDSFRLIEALQVLEQYSIVTVSGRPDDVRLLMHPLISAWAFDRQSREDKQESWMRAACTIALSSVRSELWNKEGFRLRPHLRALLLRSSGVIFDDRPKLMWVRVLLRCGWLSLELHLNAEVHRLSQELLEHLNLNDQNLHEQWIPLYKLVAPALKRCGRAERAIPLLEQIVNAESSLPPDHSSRVTFQCELAYAYRSNGNFVKAREILEHMVNALEKILDIDDELRLMAEHNLATVHLNEQQLQQAIQSMERILRIRAKTLAQSHTLRQGTQYSLAILYLKDKQTGQAVKLLEDFVHEFAQALSDDHPFRIGSQTKLAWAYHADGQTQRGESLLGAIINSQDTWTHMLPDEIIAHKVYAIMLWEQNRKIEAIAMMKKVVDTCRELLSDKNLQRTSAQAWLEYMELQTGAWDSDPDSEPTPPEPELGCYMQGIDYPTLVRSSNTTVRAGSREPPVRPHARVAAEQPVVQSGTESGQQSLSSRVVSGVHYLMSLWYGS